MVRTEAQKRAVAITKKNLERARKHIASGGDPYSWSKKKISSGKGTSKKTRDTVIIEGKGYSVAPKLQKEFVKDVEKQVVVKSRRIVPVKEIALPKRVETYDPSLKMYGRYSEPSGQATAIYRPPTIKEAEKISLAQRRGTIPGAIEGVSYWGGKQLEKARDIPSIKKIREKIKESKIEESIVKKSKKILGKPIPEEERGIISPKGVKSIFDVSGELTLRAGEKLSKATTMGLQKVGVKTEGTFLEAPSPISRRTAKSLISEVYMFSAFSPFMKTTGGMEQDIGKIDYKKIKKYADEPIKKKTVIEPEYEKHISKEQIFGTETRAIVKEEKRILKIKKKPMEEIKIIQTKPTGKWFGEVEEVRKVGYFRKPKKYKGKIEIVGGRYKETIQYPKVLKVTEISEAGLGTTEFFGKSGKLISRLETKGRISPDIKLQSIKDKTIFKKRLGVAETRESITTRGVDMFKIKAPKMDKKTGLITKKKIGKIEFGRDIKAGVTHRVETFENIADVLAAKPKKIIKFKKGKGVSVLYKKDIGQKIIYGEGKDVFKKDITFFKKTPTTEELMKVRQPMVERVIIKETKHRVTTVYDPSITMPKKLPLKVKPTKPMTKIKPTKETPSIVGIGGKVKTVTKKATKKLDELLYVRRPEKYLKVTKTKVPTVHIRAKVIKPKTRPLSVSRRITTLTPLVLSKVSTAQAISPMIKQDVVSDTLTKTDTKMSDIFKKPTATVGKVTTSPVSTRPMAPRFSIYKKPVQTKKPKIIPFGFPSLALPKAQGKKQGYIPQAKSQGGRWVNLSRKPMNRQAALSRGAKATDQTLSAQFRIKKTKGEVVGNGDSYFGMTQHKYRPYRIKKGKAIKLHDQFIEKRGSRIDTLGEKRNLKLAKFVKKQGWLAKPKKTKSQWII